MTEQPYVWSTGPDAHFDYPGLVFNSVPPEEIPGLQDFRSWLEQEHPSYAEDALSLLHLVNHWRQHQLQGRADAFRKVE